MTASTPPKITDPRQERLIRAYKARADYLSKPFYDSAGVMQDPGVSDPMEAVKLAVEDLPRFLKNNPDSHQPWRDYLDGKSDQIPAAYAPRAISLQERQTELMSIAREQKPWLAAGTDALNTVGSLGEGFVQGVTDMATGAANLIPGVTVPRVDVKASLRAFALNHVPWLKEQGKTFTTEETRRELDATKDSANALTQVAEMTGQGIGSMYSMIGTGGTGAIGKVSQVTSAPFRGAMKLGDGIGKTLGTLTGKVALAQSAGAVLGSAAGIAADKAIKAGTTQDAATGQERKTTMGERAGQAGVGAAEGALFGLLGEVGKAAFRSMFKSPLSKLGVDEKDAVTTLSEWAKQNRLFQVGRETTEAYSKRLLNAYAESGFPGAPRMYGRQILGRAMQGGIEGLGFSALDERFHRDLFDGAFQGDTQALKRALIAYGAGVFQTMAMHIPLKDIPRAQRRQDFTPTGEAPKPQEPVKQATPKPREPVDPTGGGQQTLVTEPGFAPPRKANNRDKLRRFGWVDVAKAKPQEPFKADYQSGVVGEGLRPPEAPPQQPRESQPYDSAMLGPIKGFDPSMKPEQIEALGRVDAGQVYTERHQNVDYSSIGPGPAPKPDTIDYYKDDSLRQHYAEQAKTFDGDVKIKVGSNAAQQALQFIPQRTKAYKQLKDIAENKASGTVDFTAEEARRFVDYHARSAPRRRTTEDIKMSQPKIKALDSIAEKLLAAYGKPLEPPRAEPTQGPDGPLPSGPIGVKTSGDAPMEAEARTGPDDGPVEMEIVGTPFDFQIKDGMAWASPKLEDALGLDGPVPEAEFMQAVEGAATMSALVAKEQLPGTVISADGIVAVPDGDGVMRTVRLGEVLESPLSPTPTWVPAESFPARGKDPIPQEQAQVVEILTDIVNNRQDLPEHTRAMLSKAADVMDTVSLHNDEAVAETMGVVADLVPVIAQGTPEQAAKAVQALGESLTVKHPEIALRDMAGPQEPAPAPQRADTVTEFAQSASQDKIGQRRIASTLRTAQKFNGEVKSRGLEVERLVSEGASVVVGKEGRRLQKQDGGFFAEKDITKTAMDYAEFLVKRRDDNPDGYGPAQVGMGVPIPREAGDIARVGGKGALEGASKAWSAYQASKTKRAEEVTNPTIGKIGREAASQERVYDARYNKAGVGDMLRLSTKARKELEQVVTDKDGYQTTVYVVNRDAGAKEHFGAGPKLSEEARRGVESGDAIQLETGRVAEENKVEFLNAGEDGPQRFTTNERRKRHIRMATPEGIHAMDVQKGEVWDAMVRFHEINGGWTPERTAKHYNDVRAAMRRDATEYLRVHRSLPTRVPTKGGMVKIFEDTPVEHSVRLARTSSHVMSVKNTLARYPVEPKPGDRDYKGNVEGSELPTDVQAQLNRIATDYGDAAADTVADMFRPLMGMSNNGRNAWMGEPGTAYNKVARVIVDLINLAKVSKLPLSFVKSMFEAPADSPFLTFGGILRGYKDLFKSFMDFSIRGEYRRMVEDGWIKDSHENTPLQGMDAVETFSLNLEKAKQLILTPVTITQGVTEMVKVYAARERLQAMREGNGTTADLNALKLLEFPAEAAMRMVDGKGTESEYQQYKTSIIGALSGGKSLHGVYRSAASDNRGFNALIWYNSYFQTRARAMDALGSRVAEARGMEKVEASAQLFRMAAFTVLAGALGELASKALKGELGDYLRESTKDFGSAAEATLKLLAGGLLGGVGTPISDTISELDSGKSTEDILGGAIPRALPILGVVGDFTDLVRSTVLGANVPGYEGKSLAGKVSKYLQEFTPLASTLHRGLFGLSALAITEHDPALDAAQRSLWRWGADNPDYVKGRFTSKEKTAEFRSAMRKVVDRVMSGDTWTDEQLSDALLEAEMAAQDEADKAGEPVTMREIRNRVAASLRERKMLPKKLPQEIQENMEDHLGADHYQTLQDYDRVLEAMARHVSPQRRF